MSIKVPPDIPDYFRQDVSHMSTVGILLALFAYRDACYLAGIEDAKACVPEAWVPDMPIKNIRLQAEAHNACRETTLANLSALEEKVKK